jgi:hypothetical protein
LVCNKLEYMFSGKVLESIVAKDWTFIFMVKKRVMESSLAGIPLSTVWCWASQCTKICSQYFFSTLIKYGIYAVTKSHIIWPIYFDQLVNWMILSKFYDIGEILPKIFLFFLLQARY